MVPRTKWIERKFNFDYPVGLYPCIIERLRGTPSRLEEITRSLSPEVLTEKVDGKWSIQEHVGHIMDVDALHDARLDEYVAGAETLQMADMSNRRTQTANHNDPDLAALLADVRKTREALVSRFDGYDEAMAARSAFHPRLRQPMRVTDMALFAAEHDDQHMASIMELIRRLTG